jgi:CHAT domain-containing protein
MFHEQDRLAMGGKYSELERSSEEGKDITAAKSTDLIEACISYSKLKKYNKLFACLDQLENNIKLGDKLVAHHGMFSWNYPENISVIPALLKAEAYIEFGDYEKSVSFAKTAYESLPAVEWTSKDRTNSWIRRYKIRSWGMLALAYALKGDNKQASQFVTQLENESASSSEFWLTPGGIQSAINKEKGFELARVYMALGQYDRILAAKENLWDTFASVSEGMFGTLFAFVDLPKAFMTNKALYETGHIKEAKEGYDRLLSKPETKSNGDIYWPILLDRGRITEREGDLKGAVDYYRQAVDVIEQQRSTINTEASKIGFVGDKQAVYRQLVAALFADRQYAMAFEYVERSKSRALVDMLAAKRDFAVVSGDPTKVKNLLAMANNAETEAMLQGSTAEKPQTRSLVVSTRQQLHSESPELASLINVSSLAAAEIQALIPPDEVLIEYYYNAPDLIAFVLTGKGLNAVRLDSSGLLESVRQYRKHLESANSTGYLELSRQLYNQLLRPVISQISAKKLIIVAHGSLHYLPFNALHNGQDYLIERYSLRMLPSASVLKYLRTEPVAKQGNLLAFGNPDLGNPQFDLAYAQDEAIAITKNRPQSRVLLRKDANETAFRQYAGGFRYLHFATHGEFNADAPLKSALRLAKDEQSDGMLTVDKLYSIKLDADLVTLSACETGLGKIANGDDVVGLTRGFLYAGSRSIVASLWQVDDLATAYLMTRFYDNLQQADKREALRQAQLDTRKKYAHPFYWAAFQITGNAQ